jgi:hypothetical protein
VDADGRMTVREATTSTRLFVACAPRLELVDVQGASRVRLDARALADRWAASAGAHGRLQLDADEAFACAWSAGTLRADPDGVCALRAPAASCIRLTLACARGSLDVALGRVRSAEIDARAAGRVRVRVPNKIGVDKLTIRASDAADVRWRGSALRADVRASRLARVRFALADKVDAADAADTAHARAHVCVTEGADVRVRARPEQVREVPPVPGTLAIAPPKGKSESTSLL